MPVKPEQPSNHSRNLPSTYGFYWFAITQTTDVPSLTLQLWQDMKEWEKREKKLSTSCLKKIDRHTWYLSGRQVIFSLWSKRVDEETKVKIAKVLHQTPEEEVTPGKPDLPRIYEDSTLSDFVTTESWLLFQLLNIQPTFLEKPFEEWASDESFQSIDSIIHHLKVVNDAGERSVKFGSDFSNKLVKDDNQRQALLQGVESHRRAHPKATKKSMQ